MKLNYKNEIAEKEGFTVLVIWDFEDKKLALEKCLDLIKLKLSEMKN